MNKWQGVGNLVRDPELRQTTNGKSVCTFTVAISRGYNKDETDYIPIVTWEKQAESCGRYLKKGSKVAVTGAIQTRSYESKGEKRYATEIVADAKDGVEFIGVKRGEDMDLF